MLLRDCAAPLGVAAGDDPLLIGTYALARTPMMLAEMPTPSPNWGLVAAAGYARNGETVTPCCAWARVVRTATSTADTLTNDNRAGWVARLGRNDGYTGVLQ